ncbi:hypothetical protein CMI37_33670 [Candidatus Pacearchaeota archaeon]|nr:hypothetical protein [Candidatus Pacearchaeota archaeon]|tara:strand:+ start:799 stop:978 length:180 start_codon:yes stop_codon:yes gene_type:complete
MTRVDRKKAINLLDQIIEKAKLEDLEHKRRVLAAHKASKSVGESWMIHHLNILRRLLNE